MLIEASEAEVRGGLLKARLDYIVNQGGPALLARCLARLREGDAVLLGQGVQRDSWYPASLRHRLDETIASTVAPDNRADVLIDLGRFMADVLLGGAPGAGLSSGDPHSFLARVPQMYADHHTVGHREYEHLGNNEGVIRTWVPVDPTASENCWVIAGCLQRGLEIAGAEAVLVSEGTCRDTGATSCHFLCEWRTDGNRQRI